MPYVVYTFHFFKAGGLDNMFSVKTPRWAVDRLIQESSIWRVHQTKQVVVLDIWVFPKTAVPENGWFYNGKPY